MYDAGRRKFYCSDTFACVWAWDVENDLSLTRKRKFLAKEDCDGMALDAEGNVWIAGFPPGSITQVRFGGADMRDYYINVVPADGGDSLKEGRPLSGASYLYRGRSAVPGMPLAPARFRLG